MIFIAIHIVLLILLAALYVLYRTTEITSEYKKSKNPQDAQQFSKYMQNLDDNDIAEILMQKKEMNEDAANIRPVSSSEKNAIMVFLFLFSLLGGNASFAQSPKTTSLSSEPGIIITFILILIPILTGVIIMAVKISNLLWQQRDKNNQKKAAAFSKYLSLLSKDATASLQKRKSALEFRLTGEELSGIGLAEDSKGLINNVNTYSELPFVAVKKKALKRPDIDAGLSKLILWYIGCAAFWLLFGTSIGEYVGIKFVAPDVDHISWLSFGRLRPVHTNAVFWGWSSLAMLGLGYYIVPMVSNTSIASLKRGWYTLVLINTTIIIGSILLMGGINNGGGEYREYIWPVMLLFGIGLLITLVNFLQTIAKRPRKKYTFLIGILLRQ